MSLKCRNCILIGHEHCITANQHLINECHSTVLINGHNGTNATSSSSKDHLPGSAAAEVAAVAARHGLASSLLPPLDTSSYSVQTSSSCSTTPNSNYSSQHAANSHQNQGGATNGGNNNGAGSSSSGIAVNSASAVAYQQYHGCKLDTDIGSACGKQFIFKHF